MAAPLSSSELTTLQAFLDAESQFMFLAVIVAERQSAYNDANTSAPKSQISIAPNYTTNSVALQAAFPLKHTAVGLKLQDAIVAPLTGV